MYFLSGCVAPGAFRGVDADVGAGVVVAGAVVGATATLAPGIVDVEDVGSGGEAASLPLADDSNCYSGIDVDGDN